MEHFTKTIVALETYSYSENMLECNLLMEICRRDTMEQRAILRKRSSIYSIVCSIFNLMFVRRHEMLALTSNDEKDVVNGKLKLHGSTGECQPFYEQ